MRDDIICRVQVGVLFPISKAQQIELEFNSFHNIVVLVIPPQEATRLPAIRSEAVSMQLHMHRAIYEDYMHGGLAQDGLQYQVAGY